MVQALWWLCSLIQLSCIKDKLWDQNNTTIVTVTLVTIIEPYHGRKKVIGKLRLCLILNKLALIL